MCASPKWRTRALSRSAAKLVMELSDEEDALRDDEERAPGVEGARVAEAGRDREYVGFVVARADGARVEGEEAAAARDRDGATAEGGRRRW